MLSLFKKINLNQCPKCIVSLYKNLNLIDISVMCSKQLLKKNLQKQQQMEVSSFQYSNLSLLNLRIHSYSAPRLRMMGKSDQIREKTMLMFLFQVIQRCLIKCLLRHQEWVLFITKVLLVFQSLELKWVFISNLEMQEGLKQPSLL